MLIIPVHNRIGYNKITLPVLLHIAKMSKRTGHVHIIDDESTDGTSEWINGLPDIEGYLECTYTYVREKIGSSSKQWLMGHELAGNNIKYLADFCNDQLLPDGIIDLYAGKLDETNKVYGIGNDARSNVPGLVYPFIKHPLHWHRPPHIGSGIIRRECLNIEQLKPNNRFYGFTKWQYGLKKKGYYSLCSHGVNCMPLDKSPLSMLEENTRSGDGRNIIGNISSVFNRKTPIL